MGVSPLHPCVFSASDRRAVAAVEGPRAPCGRAGLTGARDRPSGRAWGWERGLCGSRGWPGGRKKHLGKGAQLYLENPSEGLPPSCPQTLAHGGSRLPCRALTPYPMLPGFSVGQVVQPPPPHSYPPACAKLCSHVNAILTVKPSKPWLLFLLCTAFCFPRS